jgi:NAD-dependent deacetylase
MADQELPTDAALAAEHGATLDRVAAELGQARRVLFITGAGLSADAGLPTYRGVGGLYDGGDTEEGIAIEEALSGDMMASRPEICWKHIRQIEQASRGARPSLGHEVMARLEQQAREVWVLTQNVDGLHRAAGSSRVIDIHGDVHRLRCTGCDAQRTVADYAELAPLPRCPECGAVVRPDVVLFGEMLPLAELAHLQAEIDLGFDVVLSVGTSSLFPYIVQPIAIQARRGGFSVEINPERTVASALVSERLPMRAALALGEIARRLGL